MLAISPVLAVVESKLGDELDDCNEESLSIADWGADPEK
jgi:hypothetical protein